MPGSPVSAIRRALEGDEGFSVLPDLILMDGGKGHVNAAIEMIRAMDLDLAVAGMAKDDTTEPVRWYMLKTDRCGSFACGNIRCFTSTWGRFRRKYTVLPLIITGGCGENECSPPCWMKLKESGPAKRGALLDHFGSVERIKQASVEELREVKGITEKLAEKIREYFHC